MTRNAMILIFVCALAGALFYVWNLDSAWRFVDEEHKVKDPRMPISATVVYAIRDIAEGQVIFADSIGERPGLAGVGGTGSLPSSSAVLGRKARRKIWKGQGVSLYNLEPFPLEYADPVVIATKEIQKDSIIRAEDVKDFAIEKSLSSSKFLSNSSMVIGKKSKRFLTQGLALSKGDVEP